MSSNGTGWLLADYLGAYGSVFPSSWGSWGDKGGPVGSGCMAPGLSGFLTLTCPCCLGNEDGHYTGPGNSPEGYNRPCDLCEGQGEIDVRLD
jgi:hypothetical protein